MQQQRNDETTTYKPFIYLVNARQALAKNFFHLQKENSDCIIVTWDKPLAGCLYFPDSIWSKARNLLLQKAKEQAQSNDYEYYIFLDDDVSFVTGSFKQFEKSLLRHQPKVAGTRYGTGREERRGEERRGEERRGEERRGEERRGDNTLTAFLKKTLASLWHCVFCFPYCFDLCVVAHHKDVVMRDLLLPYDESVDEDNDVTSSHVFLYLMRALYPKSSIYFLNFSVFNRIRRDGTERRYIKSEEERKQLTRRVSRCLSTYTHLSSVEITKLNQDIPAKKFAKDHLTLANLLRNYRDYLAYIFYYKRTAHSVRTILKPNYFEYKQELMRKQYTYQDLRT